ncbi:hypothetical protein C8Q77DRAFT_1270586 [Trametes polyzona]|nr:hypothetical protein C8Q77DRAFT_1270586 [Trametes polyzona]
MTSPDFNLYEFINPEALEDYPDIEKDSDTASVDTEGDPLSQRLGAQDYSFDMAWPHSGAMQSSTSSYSSLWPLDDTTNSHMSFDTTASNPSGGARNSFAGPTLGDPPQNEETVGLQVPVVPPDAATLASILQFVEHHTDRRHEVPDPTFTGSIGEYDDREKENMAPSQLIPVQQPSGMENQRRDVLPEQSLAHTKHQHHAVDVAHAMAGPSSVTLDDLSASSHGQQSHPPSLEDVIPRAKRGRRTQTEVESKKKHDHTATTCGLDGGKCKELLVDDPKANTKHMRTHKFGVYDDDGQLAYDGCTLKRRGATLSTKEISCLRTANVLQCTWRAPDGRWCGETFQGTSRKANLERHVRNKHWGREYECPKCHRTFSTLFSLTRHEVDGVCEKDGESETAIESEGESRKRKEREDDGPPHKRRRTD